MEISLQPVSSENWYDCTKLDVTKDQKKVFPAPIVYWIAESKYVTEFQPLAIYYNTEIIGFIVYCKTPDSNGNYWVPALMIDEKYQGKGYGKEATKQLIALMREIQHCQRIMIGHRPENTVAGNLYESLGFEKISNELIDGEVVRLLT